MTQNQQICGVFAPVLTPFNEDLSPDPARFIAHCKWVISQDCGLVVFGTTSEANSLSVEERISLLDGLLAADVDRSRIIVGTGCCALTDTVRLSKHAVDSGCPNVLMLPPFYYKGVSEDGIFRSFSEVIERVGDSRLRIYLYHIPPVAVVGITPGLVERLLKEYPTAIAGMKDSSGDWNNTLTMLGAFRDSGFDVFVGSESFLLANMENGGAGCISATANINPEAIERLYREWQGANADAQQQALNSVRAALSKYTMIPSLKAVVAYFRNDPLWENVRPPLSRLTPAEAANVIEGLKKLGFGMPGIVGPKTD